MAAGGAATAYRDLALMGEVGCLVRTGPRSRPEIIVGVLTTSWLIAGPMRVACFKGRRATPYSSNIARFFSEDSIPLW